MINGALNMIGMPLTKTLPNILDYPLNKNEIMVPFRFYQEIEKGAGIIDEVVDWCKSEISTEWRWQLLELSSSSRPGKYRFFFETERDYCSFLLKWG